MYKKTTVCAKWCIPCIFFVRKDSLQNAKHCYTTVFIYMKVVVCRGVHWTPALMSFYVYKYIFDVMKIVYSILHALRAIVCVAHERENTVLPYKIAVTL